MTLMKEKLKKLFVRYEEIIRYLVVGALTTVISLAVYYPLIWYVFDAEKEVQHAAANTISWIAAVAFAYFANRIFVFKSKEKNIAKEAAKFVSSRIGSFLVETAIILIFVNALGFTFAIELFGKSFMVMKIIAQVVVIILNYVFGKLLVFKKKDEQKEDV